MELHGNTVFSDVTPYSLVNSNQNTEGIGEGEIIQIRIRKVLCSNLGLDTGHLPSDFSWFFLVPPSKFWYSTGLGHNRFLVDGLQFIIHPILRLIN
jgi:hypothetical protein